SSWPPSRGNLCWVSANFQHTRNEGTMMSIKALQPTAAAMSVWRSSLSLSAAAAAELVRSALCLFSLQGVKFLAFAHVPKADRVAIARRRQGLAIGREGHTHDDLLLRQGADLLARVHLPQPDRLVETARSQGVAVGGERHGSNQILMPGEGADF